MADWVELRVHGVHGTSPGAMLGVGDGDVGQVAGDSLTGVYRVEGTKVPLRTLDIPAGIDGKPGRIEVEAYSWGALTSGAQGALGWVRRVLWMLLLPFALSNLAYWARLHVAVGDGRDHWGSRAVRGSGILLTVFMVLTPCVIAVDMLGWQCYRGGVPRCSRLPGLLEFLAGLAPGQRLVLTSGVPLLALVVLWFLSRQTTSSYEGPSLPVGLPNPHVEILRRRAMWGSRERTDALRTLHVAAAAAAVVAFVSTHVALVHPATATRVWSIVLVAVAGLVVLGCLVAGCLQQRGDMEPRGEAKGPHTKWGSTLLGLAILLVLAQSIRLWVYRGPMDESQTYRGVDWWFLGLFVLLTALHLSVFFGARARAVLAVPVVLLVGGGGLTVVVLMAAGVLHLWSGPAYWWALGGGVLAWVLTMYWHYRHAAPEPFAGIAPEADVLDQVAWRGAGASVLLAAAAWVGLLFTSSAVIASANYLNGPQSVADLLTRQPVSSAVTANTYAADGKITISHAVVSVGNNEIVIRTGSVSADRFSAQTANTAVDERLGTTRVSQPFGLTTSQDVIDLESSCSVPFGTTQLDCNAPGALAFDYDQVRTKGRPVLIRPALGDVVTLRPREQLQSALVIPQVLSWTPLGQLFWLLLAGVVLAWCAARFYGTGAHEIAAVLTDAPVPPDDAVPVRDRASALAKRKSAGLAHRAETLLDAAGAVTALVAVLLIISSMTDQAPWERPGLTWTRGLANLSFYLMLAMAAGMVLIGSYLRRSEAARKAVGILWDLTTFWPRAAHPLAPPCYAERVVPELETRARWVLGSAPNSHLILSGHSQGSLILASMASRLDDELFARTRFITYGSQIRGLYGRVFPCVFGADAIGYEPTPGRTRLVEGFPDSGFGNERPSAPAAGSLRARIEGAGGSWVSLFRRSDPLGYRVFADDDAALPKAPVPPPSGSDVPVMEVPTADRGDPGPTVGTHGGYPQTQTYRDVVCRWVHETPFETTYEPAGVVDLPPFPAT